MNSTTAGRSERQTRGSRFTTVFSKSWNNIHHTWVNWIHRTDSVWKEPTKRYRVNTYQKSVEYRGNVNCTMYTGPPLLPISRQIFKGEWKNKKGTFIVTIYRTGLQELLRYTLHSTHIWGHAGERRIKLRRNRITVVITGNFKGSL